MYFSSNRFFFFKQKTAYEMRISDWSSDVCSSDLGVRADDGGTVAHLARRLLAGLARPARTRLGDPLTGASRLDDRARHPQPVARAAGAGDDLVVVDDLAGLYPGVELPVRRRRRGHPRARRSEAHTSELQSLMRISYAVFCLKKNTI